VQNYLINTFSEINARRQSDFRVFSKDPTVFKDLKVTFQPYELTLLDRETRFSETELEDQGLF
jgi:hypothetical protein